MKPTPQASTDTIHLLPLPEQIRFWAWVAAGSDRGSGLREALEAVAEHLEALEARVKELEAARA